MPYFLDDRVMALQNVLRAEVAATRIKYELLKTTEAKAEHLLALKKLSDMACWRPGG